MRIDGPLPLPESLQPEKTQKTGVSSKPSGLAATNPNQDRTQLSVDSKRMDQLKAALAQLPEVRQDRVAALRDAIGSGTHQVTDQQLADSIHSQLVTGKLTVT